MPTTLHFSQNGQDRTERDKRISHKPGYRSQVRRKRTRYQDRLRSQIPQIKSQIPRNQDESDDIEE